MIKKGRGGPVELDFEEAWRRMACRFAYHWECPLEEVYEWLLGQSVALLAKALFHESAKAPILERTRRAK